MKINSILYFLLLFPLNTFCADDIDQARISMKDGEETMIMLKLAMRIQTVFASLMFLKMHQPHYLLY